MSTHPTLIAVDWGSSNFRAYLTNDDATILDSCSAKTGMLQLLPEQFPGTLKAHVGHWLDQYQSVPILMSGMVGARQGWLEAAYLSCPVTLDQLSHHLTQVDFLPQHAAAIVPGLELHQGDDVDVMRGEETQLYGALSLIDRDTVTVCMPGTHSKWVQVRQNTIDRFQTFLTGELYAVLTQHSILAKVDCDQVEDESAFAMGVKTAVDSDRLLSDLFRARASVLLGRVAPAQVHSYVSGLLIGHELMQAQAHWQKSTQPIVMVADAAIATRYQLAFALLGCGDLNCVDPQQAVVSGLVAIHKKERV